MEFLRFGSSIPGSYWGCCACDIIQDFNQDPDDPASIQLVSGDGGSPIVNSENETLYAGPTYRDILLQRLAIGTFSKRNMPNHAFLAILTQYQANSNIGKKWLELLKEQGFEFIRAVDNSVYSGEEVIEEAGEGCYSAHPNYIFGLFRNVGAGALKDQFTPPKAWAKLPSVVPELWQTLDGPALTAEIQTRQLPLYKALGTPVFLTEKEVEKKRVVVTYAGLRSKYPQQSKGHRRAMQRAEEAKKAYATKSTEAVFALTS